MGTENTVKHELRQIGEFSLEVAVCFVVSHALITLIRGTARFEKYEDRKRREGKNLFMYYLRCLKVRGRDPTTIAYAVILTGILYFGYSIVKPIVKSYL